MCLMLVPNKELSFTNPKTLKNVTKIGTDSKPELSIRVNPTYSFGKRDLEKPFSLIDSDSKLDIKSYVESVKLDQEISNIGFRRLLKCYYCEKCFRSFKHLELHHNLKHKTWNKNPKIRFSYVVVNGKYIEWRIEKCKSETLVFSHHYDSLRREGMFERDQCHEKKIILNSCYLRGCPKCESTRRYRYTKKYRNALLGFKRVSVVLLTFVGHHKLSKQTMREHRVHIRNFMKKLGRRLVYELQYIRVLELKNHENLYFYHYHFLIDLPYINQKSLSQMWHQTTKTSFVVDIRILRDNKNRPVGLYWNRLKKQAKMTHASNYITKYLAKPISNITSDEYAAHIYGTHFVETHLTCSLGQNSSTKTSMVCKFCNDPLTFDYDDSLKHTNNYKPPPKQTSYDDFIGFHLLKKFNKIE